MTKRSAALAWLMLIIMSGAYLAYRAHQGPFLRTDLSSLLPREEQDPALQKADDYITDTLSHRIVLLVGHRDRLSARTAATEIIRQLSASGLFAVNPMPDKDRLKQIGTFYYPYRLGLLSEEDRERLKSGRAQEIADRAVSQVYGIFGLSNAKLLHNDPFLLLPGFLTSLPLPSSRLTLDDGLLSVEDNGITWVLISGQLKAQPFSLDTQKEIVDILNTAANKQIAAYPGLKILRLGTVFYAKAAAEEAIHETSIIAVLSTIGTILLVLIAFRTLRPLLLSLLVIGAGVLVATSATLWIFGDLHVGALLFGVSLIGVTVDYSLQYCTEIFARPTSTPPQRLERVFAGITLGAATTIIGYLTLCLAPFPGLHQIAIFSALGLAAAWTTVVLWLPLLDRKGTLAHGESMLSAADGFLTFWTSPKSRPMRIGIFCLAIIVGMAGYERYHADDDIHHMQSLSADLTAQQEQIQRLTGMAESSRFFLVQAPDDETALQREEALADRLRPLIRAGDLTGVQALSQYIPSILRQKENRKLQLDDLYGPLLKDQIQKIGLADAPAAPAQDAPFLTLSDAKRTDVPLPMLSMLLLGDVDGSATHVVLLDHATNLQALLRTAETIPGVRLVNPAENFSNLLEKYRHRAVALLILSAILMTPLLVWRYGLHKGLWIMVPPLLAVLLTPPLRFLAGGDFTFFDAMALVLIFSIGVDYAVFCAETSGTRKRVTMLAVAMAACTALMSFGFLALSQVMAVHNFGATMTIGILLSFLFSPLGALSNRANISLSLRRIISIAFILILCGCAEHPPDMQPNLVSIGPGLNMTIPPPGTLGRPVEALQLVTAHYGNRDFAFEARISGNSERFMLTGVDLMGQKIFSILWTKDGIKYERTPWVPSQLKPENILADIVLLYWPDKVVKSAISSRATLTESSNKRSIYLDGRKIWQATYHPVAGTDLWEGKLQYRNLAWGYAFDVQSKEGGR